MNIEEIKVGERYNVCGYIGYKNEDEISITFECKPGVYCSIPFAKSHASMYFSLPPTPPKYDPCRKFKKGDKVKLIEWNGRTPYDTHHELKPPPGEVHIVIEDEYDRNEVYIGMSAADEHQSVVHACHLELVTPVEELEPYKVEKRLSRYAVYYHDPDEDGMTGRVYEQAAFYFGHPNQYTKDEALAAAEAERDRLNEEYRNKHQNEDL